MKLTATREATIRDIEPGEIVTNDEGRWVVDEVRRTLAGVELMCRPEGRTDGKRTSLEFKSSDESVTVEAGHPDGAEILATLVKLIAVPDHIDAWPYDKAAGTLTLTVGTQITGKVAGRVWNLVFQA